MINERPAAVLRAFYKHEAAGQIAPHAFALGVTLVSNNTREFARVPGLQVENWAAAA